MSAQDNPFGGSYSVQYGSDGASAPANGADAGGLVKDTTTAAFAADVIQESRRQPVLVDFWAPWCGPCRMIAPALDELAEEYDGRAKVVKVDIDQNQATALKYHVRSIPMLLLFKDGQVQATQVGAVGKPQLAKMIDQAL